MQKNEAQEQAIVHIDGPMIIIACPGSGKTTTLLRRINYMIKSSIKGDNILMVTFTKAAAQEMRERFEKEYGSETGVTFCTIHSLCYRILLNYMPNTPRILSEQDIRAFLMNHAKRNKNINDKNDFVNDLLLDISLLKNNKIELKDFKPKCIKDKKFFDKVFLSYEKFKKDNNMMDMDDMLIYAYDILNSDIRILRLLQNKYQYIQVDEYQDTNYIQRDILYLLAGEKKNLVVVGDDDQAIYGFRGARPEIMLNFSKDFPNAKEIFMSTNYRSCKSIIKAADRLIKMNILRFKKEFVGFKEELGHVEVQSGYKRPEELEMVMKKIEALKKAGEDYKNIAILYRTNNQSMMVAENCIKYKIPFKTTENITSKYHHWLFWDLYSYHKLATGTGNKLDLMRILNHPMRFLFGEGFTANGLNKQEMKDFASSQTSKELWQITNMHEEIDKLFSFLNLIKDLGPFDTIRYMNSRLDYKSYIRNYAKSRNEEPDDLLDIWEDYYMEARDKGLNDWGKWESYIRLYEQELNKIKTKQEGITLSTMHKSKGLEWEHVFLVDCIEDNHPNSKALGLIELEEERRLFYVAMTRAKKFLYLYYYRKRGQRNVNFSEYIKQMDI